MNLIERYIFRIAAGAFLACLLALTAVIWITQALRELDLITSKGQTILVFFSVMGLSIPTFIAVISPIALFIATIYTLNRLNSDSELIVISAAGVPPGRVMRPFLSLAGIVCLVVAVLTLYIMPSSFQELRDLVARIRTDFVANVVREGQFTSLENGVTFHFRERSGEALLGIFMQDRREPTRTVVYLAERGQTASLNGQSYLVLEQGSVHRQQPSSRDSSIVAFERYAIDLAALNQEASDMVYKPRERSTADLLLPDEKEFYYRFQAGRFRAELHDRLSSWLFPLAAMFIAFAALGESRTTRQGRGISLASAVLAVGALRIAGFAASSAAVRSPWALIAVYGIPIAAILGCMVVIFQGRRLEWLAGQALQMILSVRLPRAPRLRGA